VAAGNQKSLGDGLQFRHVCILAGDYRVLAQFVRFEARDPLGAASQVQRSGDNLQVAHDGARTVRWEANTSPDGDFQSWVNRDFSGLPQDLVEVFSRRVLQYWRWRRGA